MSFGSESLQQCKSFHVTQQVKKFREVICALLYHADITFIIHARHGNMSATSRLQDIVKFRKQKKLLLK